MSSLQKKNTAISTSKTFEVIEQIPAESVWLANFNSENTRSVYQTAVREFIQTVGISSKDELFRAQQSHILAWREHMKKLGWSNSTIAVRLSALSSLYKFLATKGLCPINPVSGIKRPKTGNAGIGGGKTPSLTKKQVRAMLDAPNAKTVQGLRDRALLYVYFYTGGRCSEPSYLRVKDFRMDGDYWVLEMKIKGGKTNTIALHTECQIAIRKYLEVSGHAEDRDGLLFRQVKNGLSGKPISRVQFYRLFKKYALSVGLPEEVVPHSARATFITNAYEAGWQGEDIQRTVGHSSITTTEGYNHTVKKHRKSASFAMNY